MHSVYHCCNLSIERLKNLRFQLYYLKPCSGFGFLFRVGVKCSRVSEEYTAYFFRVTVGSSACEVTRKVWRLYRIVTLKMKALCFSETSGNLTIARCTNTNEYRRFDPTVALKA